MVNIEKFVQRSVRTFILCLVSNLVHICGVITIFLPFLKKRNTVSVYPCTDMYVSRGGVAL